MSNVTLSRKYNLKFVFELSDSVKNLSTQPFKNRGVEVRILNINIK